MTLLQNGIASSVVTLCVLVLGAMLWAMISPRWPIFVLGWVFGVGTILLTDRVKQWWHEV
jgi:hypothetical protein